jgi:signal transduction histidine kinase
MHSFKVEMVNIYAAERDIIAYSFSRDMIGRENLGGSAHQKAMQGKPTSKLAQTGRLWRLFLGMPKTIKIVTFAPLKADKPLSPTAPLGVVEIVQDLSSDYRSILRFQMLTLLTVVGVMSILFVLLTNVVKRGEGIIQKKTQEQLQLKDQLSRAKHLSSLGEMIAGVSHEIRNPLGIISSSAELLLKKMPADDAMRAIPAIIIEESTRLNAIITDFLNYARPSAPNLQECRIEEVIHKTIRYISSQIEKKGYAVGAHLDKNLPTIRADADMLYQAFLNLVINATQAMPEGGAIDVRATSVDNNLWIAFEDRGEGIPAEILEKIWDPFFTTKDKGTGLGLGIVRKIIEAHEGQIRIDNRPEGGTRVSIRLPVVERF